MARKPLTAAVSPLLAHAGCASTDDGRSGTEVIQNGLIGLSNASTNGWRVDRNQDWWPW